MKHFVTFTLAVLVSVQSLPAGENWPRFRGPTGAGHSDEKGFPVRWTEDDYAWKTKLPGLGHSSPSVWGDHVFLTCAVDEGRKRFVVDVDASTGQIRWQKELEAETHKIFRLNSYASATPALDGKRAYVVFASGKEVILVAYDFEGERAWLQKPDSLVNSPPHGWGGSLIVFRDLVIFANSQTGSSFALAVDSATGEERWKTELKSTTGAHSTPFIVDKDGADPALFLSNVGTGIACLDPRNGNFKWRANILSSRVVASPVYGHGLVFATTGGGGAGRFLAAVPAAGEGDFDKSRAVWTRERELPYVPTPIIDGDELYLWGDKGTVVCLDAKTGNEVWKERVEGEFSGSPIWLDGKLYCTARDGKVAVIAAGRKFELLAENQLGEGSHATPAVAGGRMFLRGFEHLFCLRAKAVSE